VVGCSVISVTHSRFGSVTVKFRLTRSELGAPCGSRTVQPRRRPGRAPGCQPDASVGRPFEVHRQAQPRREFGMDPR
jgi:hypothetical protein